MAGLEMGPFLPCSVATSHVTNGITMEEDQELQLPISLISGNFLFPGHYNLVKGMKRNRSAPNHSTSASPLPGLSKSLSLVLVRSGRSDRTPQTGVADKQQTVLFASS